MVRRGLEMWCCRGGDVVMEMRLHIGQSMELNTSTCVYVIC